MPPNWIVDNPGLQSYLDAVNAGQIDSTTPFLTNPGVQINTGEPLDLPECAQSADCGASQEDFRYGTQPVEDFFNELDAP
jgi:hypothetical protein